MDFVTETDQPIKWSVPLKGQRTGQGTGQGTPAKGEKDRWSGFQKRIESVWKKTQDRALAKVGTYALKNFGKSKYARQSFNTLPTSVIAGLLKAIVNFLILYRLHTGAYWFDFCLSMLVTMVTAAISPVFYVIAQEREADLMAFSNHFLDQLMAQGVDYLRMWQSRSAVVLGAVAIVFLLFVEVNSTYLIQCIIEYLLAFWVVDKVNQFRDVIFLPVPLEVSREFYPPPTPQQLTKYDVINVEKVLSQATRSLDRHVKIAKSKLPKQAKHLFTKKEWIQHVKQTEIVNATELSPKQSKMGGSMRRVMDDWVRLT